MINLKQLVATLSLVIAASLNSPVHSQSREAQQPAVPGTVIRARIVEDSSAAPGWAVYEIGASPTASLIFPSKPAETAQNVAGQLINTYVSSNSTGVYTAVRVDGLLVNLERASEEARSKYFTAFFKGFAEGFEKGAVGSIKDKLEVLEVTQVPTAAGRNGFQQRLKLGTAQGRGQMVFVGNSAFGIVALWWPDAPASEVAAFFNSFRLK